jgi:riboflavin kinase/FMN adenylyltransferase
MKITRYLNHLPKKVNNSVLTLGNFDGVHLGHQHIIKQVLQAAKKEKTSHLIITFEPHPLTVLRPQITFSRLTYFKDKVLLLKKLGVKNILCFNFNKKFSEITAKDFCEKILKNGLKAKHVIIGYDFIFGKDRVGDSLFLESFCKKNNIKFTQVPAITNAEHNIYSSSLIRKYLSEGRVGEANKLLGYKFFLKGRVVLGKQMGAKIGFATANINIKEPQQFIKKGVYKVLVKLGLRTYKAIANIGVKPTVEGENKFLLEVHIFNFKKNIYGRKIKVFLLDFIREEQKFNSLEELKEQIKKDIQQIT